MNCTEPYMQYMEVPITTTNQILDGFFNTTPAQTPTPASELDSKEEFEEKVHKILWKHFEICLSSSIK